MGQASLTGPQRPMTDERVTLLLLRHLFPAWTITRDEHGAWRAVGRVEISATDVDGLLDLLVRTDVAGVRRALSLLAEKR